MVELQRLIDSLGAQERVAARFGVTQQFISDLVNGRRRFPDSILKQLGLRAIVVKK